MMEIIANIALVILIIFIMIFPIIDEIESRKRLRDAIELEIISMMKEERMKRYEKMSKEEIIDFMTLSKTPCNKCLVDNDCIRLQNDGVRGECSSVKNAWLNEEVEELLGGRDSEVHEPKILIEDLSLDTRTYNALHRHGIRYIGQLENYRLKDLKQLRNLGDKSISELAFLCKDAGYDFTWMQDLKWYLLDKEG